MGRSFVPCKVMVWRFGKVRVEVQGRKVQKLNSKGEGGK